jgi:hypothetical protein
VIEMACPPSLSPERRRGRKKRRMERNYGWAQGMLDRFDVDQGEGELEVLAESAGTFDPVPASSTNIILERHPYTTNRP